MSSHSTQLKRVRSKPNFGLPWLPILLGTATLMFGITGLVAVTAHPSAEIRIIVEGQQPWNISQQTAQAALKEPVASWKPLTLRVTDRTLSLAEQQGNLAPDTDILLSTQLAQRATEDDTSEAIRRDQASGKAAIRPYFKDRAQDVAAGQDIHDAYQVNVGLGHGPLAVIAAAREAALQLDDGPPRSPLPWIMGTALGLLLTAFTLSKALGRRSRWEARFRRLTTAQRQLAGIVLELEALEVTYLAIEEEQRPTGFTTAWEKVRTTSLELARTEQSVAAALYERSSGMTQATAKRLERFEASLTRLAASADAVMGAGAVIGRFGAESTFQRLAAPLSFATRELLVRLRAAPGSVIDPGIIADLESALDTLLAASTGENGSSAHAVRSWDRAENVLKRQAHAISRKLRRMLPRRPAVNPRPAEDLSVLRATLGLNPQGSWQARTALDVANATAREAFGRLPEFDDAPAPKHHGSPVNPALRTGIRRGAKVLGGTAMVLVAAFLSAIVIVILEDGSGTALTGDKQLQGLHFVPDGSRFDEEIIRRDFQDNFTEDLQVTVVPRDAEEDLGLSRDPRVLTKDQNPNDPYASIRFEPHVLLEAMWDIKAQHPELVDPLTGELPPGHALVPVWFFNNGYTIVPVRMTGEVYSGETTWLKRFDWNTNLIQLEHSPEQAVVYALKGLSIGLQENNYREPDFPLDALFWFLFPAFVLLLFIGYQVLRYGGSMSMRLGRFGKGAARLRTARTELEALAIGLDDSRLNAVLVAQQGALPQAAEADQRLFESALALAWRMAEELASRPLNQRLGGDYLLQIERLEYLVSVLAVRDTDIAGRARLLLAAMRRAD
ncbi:hypothetical protein [Arthrobacter sp. MYb227]|uniref:hypothetical protein n=1 Tax=Arthrobacter sp. MYb227 TaxID=1848601 RepID=UPI0011B0B3DF|nr:hypothetical protein [Arthrobacter sp. MYb227]